MAVSEAFNPFPVADQAYNSGRQRAQQQGFQNAFAMVGSDPVAAQNEFLRYGAPEQATAVGGIVQAKHQRDIRAQAQTMAQGGDTPGAARTLAVNGMHDDANALLKVGDDVLKQDQERYDRQAAIAHYLDQIPDDAHRAQVFATFAPELVAQKLITPESAQNPKLDHESLQFVQSRALGYKATLEMEEKRRVQALAERTQTFNENKPIIAAPGSTGINPTTGQPMFTTPNRPETKTIKDGMGNEHIVQITDAEQGGQPQAQGDPNAPRGIRNNNPLNVTALGGGQTWNGQTGVDGHYAVFATPEAGIAAADQNLQSYAQKHGINTLAGVIQRWAPPTENDTGSYIATVSKDLGVDPNQPLDLSNPQVRRSVLTSMSKVETGRANAMGQPQPQAQQGGQPQGQGQPNVREIYSSAPQQSSAANSGVTGPDFLKSVEPQRASQLKALSEGRMQFPSGMALSKPYWQSMLSDLAQYDPTFDAANPTTRSKTRADFTSGKSAQNITSMNTAIGHLGSLDKAIDELNNIGWRTGNIMGQWANRETGADANIKKFETARDAVANELTRVFRGSGGAEADIKGWKEKLDTAGSPTALHAVVNQMVDLLGSRIAALGEQYTQGMGTSAVPLDLLIPKAADTIKHLAGGGSAADLPAFRVSGQPGGPQSQGAQGGRPAPPKPGTVVKGYRFTGGDPANQANWAKAQ